MGRYKLMNDERKIKETYDCDYIVSDTELYPLQKWYNDLIDKQINDINIMDILRMIRQKVFIDIAIPKAIVCLEEDPYSGYMYEGELLEHLLEMENSILISYTDKLKNILSHALSESEDHEWLCEEEREEFIEQINKFLTKISELF